METKQLNISDTVRVLNFIKRYVKIKKDKGITNIREVFPSFTIMSKALKLSEKQLRNILRRLENQGEIERKVSRYYLKETKPKKQPAPKVEKPIERKISFFDKLPDIIQMIFTAIIYNFGNLFTIIIGVYLSTYFTLIWFNDFFKGIIPLSLSLFIVISSLISYQNYKKKRKAGYLYLWIAIILFSIATGISGQLTLKNKKDITYQESNIKDDNKILLFQNYNSRLKDIKIEINDLRKERNKLLEFISDSSFDTTDDKKEYKNLNYRIYLKKEVINKLLKENEELEKKKEELLKEDIKLNVNKKVDFFDWLQSIFKLNSDWFRFILYLILAVFADIIPPINLSNILIYKKENK